MIWESPQSELGEVDVVRGMKRRFVSSSRLQRGRGMRHRAELPPRGRCGGRGDDPHAPVHGNRQGLPGDDAVGARDQSAYVITPAGPQHLCGGPEVAGLHRPWAEELDLTAGAGVSVEGEVSETYRSSASRQRGPTLSWWPARPTPPGPCSPPSPRTSPSARPQRPDGDRPGHLAGGHPVGLVSPTRSATSAWALLDWRSASGWPCCDRPWTRGSAGWET